MKRISAFTIICLLASAAIGAELSGALSAVQVSGEGIGQGDGVDQDTRVGAQEDTAGQVCFTIVQSYANVGVVPYLSADVPTLAKGRHGASFEVKGPHETDPWQTCPGGGICNGAVLPDLSHPGADPVDGAPRYAANVSASTAQATGPGGAFNFASPRWIRLRTRYRMNPGPCLSQETFEVNANSDYPTQVFIPRGKTIQRLRTFGRRLLPGQNWIQCDDVINPPATGDWVGHGCSGMILQFGYKHLANDPSDGASGLSIGCVNKYGGISSAERLGCRIQLEYK
jgi:hypothetical protein